MNPKRHSLEILMVLGLFFILSPLIVNFILYSLIPQSGSPWHSDFVPSLDTYVSSNDSMDHSSETTIKVGKYSAGGVQVTEIGLLWLMMAPPPGPVGTLTDIILYLHCTELTQAGIVRIHRLQHNESWTIDSATLNYTNMPSYDSDYFASLQVDSEGMYSVDLLSEGGFSDYSVGGIAVIAEPGVHIAFFASECEDESDRPLVRLSGEGSISYESDPLSLALISYTNPLSLIPVGIGIALFGYLVLIKLKSKSRESVTPF